jgi:hypothetical protein
MNVTNFEIKFVLQSGDTELTKKSPIVNLGLPEVTPQYSQSLALNPILSRLNVVTPSRCSPFL